jgi:Right handed beta helix region
VLVVASITAWSPHPTDGGGYRPLREAGERDPTGVEQGALATCHDRACLPTVGSRRAITCPARSVLLRQARNIQDVIDRKPEGTTFCFGSRTYRLRGPIVPKSRDTFIGEHGAILDGSRWHTSDSSLGAFTGTARSISYVTIRNLVIRNMPQYGIATAYGANSHWTIDHNEVAGSFIGIAFPDQSIVTNNFIHHNYKYGFTGYRTTGSVFKNNEVSYNERCRCHPGDGGAMKLVGTTNDSVIGNYIHDNGGNGIWFDTDNTGVLIEGNTIIVNTKYAKAISMEKNDGTAIIRDNRIRVGSRGEVAIRLNNTSNALVSNNKVRMAFTSAGGAIHVFFDASRTGYDTTGNKITNNTITLRGSATITAGVTCANVTDCSPYWTTKGNLFQGNTYRVPSKTGRNWALVSPLNWPSWQEVGFDTTGVIISD